MSMNKIKEKATPSPSAGTIGFLKVIFGIRAITDVLIKPGSALATLFMEPPSLL
jgi:hypothetical protein